MKEQLGKIPVRTISAVRNSTAFSKNFLFEVPFPFPASPPSYPSHRAHFCE